MEAWKEYGEKIYCEIYNAISYYAFYLFFYWINSFIYL